MVCVGLLLEVFFIILFCSIIPTMRTFLFRNVHHRSWKRVSTVFHADLSTNTLNTVDPLLAWKDLKNKVLVQGNNTATLLNLIELGDQWSAGQPDKDLPFFHVSTSIPGYHKVPGCMASVHLKLLSSPSTQDKVMITGRADSRVAQGMLAFLAKVSQILLIIYLPTMTTNSHQVNMNRD